MRYSRDLKVNQGPGEIRTRFLS